METGQDAANNPAGHQLHLNGQAEAGAAMAHPEWDWTVVTGIPWRPTDRLIASGTPWARWVKLWGRQTRPDLRPPPRQHTEEDFRTGCVRNLYVLQDGALAIDTNIANVASGLTRDWEAIEQAFFQGD